MDQKALLKKIYLHAKTGKFFEVLKLIKGTKLVKESAINILTNASHGCYHNADTCDIDAIEKMTNILVTFIGALEEPHLTVYFQSIYHITLLLLKKERYEDLTKMETVIIPTFLKDFAFKDLQGVEYIYLRVIKQISQYISQQIQAKNKNHNKYFLDLMKILLKAYNKQSSPKDLLGFAQLCSNQIHELEAPNDQHLTFYSTLLEVLSSNFGKINEYIDTIQIMLIPIFSSILTDIILRQDFDFATMFLDITESKVRTNFKQEEYVNSHLMFRAVTSLFPVNKDHMQQNMDSAKSLLNTFKTSHKKLFHNIVYFMEDPLLNLLTYYRNSGLHIWCQLPDTEIINILKFLMEEVTRHSMLAPKKCNCGCTIAKNYSGTVKIGCQMVALLKSYVDQSKDLSKELFCQLGKWLYLFYGIIKKLKEGNCQKWSLYYSDLASRTYNISIMLYQAENVAFKGLFLCFLKNSLDLEGTDPQIRPIEGNTFAFSALCGIEFKSQNWTDCMGLAAMHCLLYPQNSNSIFQNWWIRPKIKVKGDTDFQQQTMLGVLYKQSKQLSHICDVQSLLTSEKKVELLILELTRYKAAWKSKISMMAAFEHLCEIADIPIIADVTLDIYGDGEVQIPCNMSSVFWNVTKQFEKFLQKNKANINVKLASAVLYYYHFKNASKESVEKNLQEMEKTMQVIESAKKDEKIEAVPKDANDECDIVSAYSNLRLSEFMETLNSLNTSLDFIMSALMGENFKPNVLQSIAKLLIKIAFEYRLHCFSIKSLQAFQVSMECAKKISDNEGHLFALSFLIESADVKKKSTKELIREADKLVKLLEKENENGRHNKLLATYHICKSQAFLHEDPRQSYEAWQKADALCTANAEKDEFQFLRSQLHVISYKLTKNCEFIQGEHDREPMTFKLHLANDIVIEMVHKQILSSYELCILFDTVYELTKAYYLMRLPRDLRAYSKHSVLLTQKSVLPLRCVTFLILLAHSDLATSKFDHCNVKLNGIDDIFCLGQSRPLMIPTNTASGTSKLDDDIDRCTDRIQELVLNVPQYTRQYSPASPTLTVDGFKFPQFVSHEKTCMCYMCLCLEFQKLLLQKYHLNALLNMHEKEVKVAEDFVSGALALHQKLNKNCDSYKAKVSKLVPDPCIPNFQDYFLEPYGNILYDYSFHMCRKSQKQEALRLNLNLINILKPQKQRYIYMYYEALMQRLSYVVTKPVEILDGNVAVGSKMEYLTTPQDSTLVQRTPSNKTTAVTVMVNGIPSYTPAKRKGKKCNLFGGAANVGFSEDLPTEANKATLATPKAKNPKKNELLAEFAVPKLKGRKPVIAAPSTPFFGGFEIPKINIFLDEGPTSTVKTYSRKRATNNVRKGDIFNKSTILSSSDASIGTDAQDDKTITDSTPGASKILADVTASQQTPVISAAASSKTKRGLVKKIKETSTRGASTARLKMSVDKLLIDKIAIPKSKENVSDESCSSVILESPEHKVAAAKTKLTLEKVKLSAKKIELPAKGRTKKVASSSELKKNLISEFEESEASNSSTKSTGAVRKSTRKRVL